MRNMNLNTVVEVATEIVNEKGEDYIYPGSFYDDCMYWDYDEQEPSCLIGHVLYNTALISTQDDFLLIENSTSDSACAFVEKWGRATFSGPAQDFLYAAQNRQDAGWTWGRSLEFAKAAAQAIENGAIEDVHDAINMQNGHDENNNCTDHWGWEE